MFHSISFLLCRPFKVLVSELNNKLDVKSIASSVTTNAITISFMRAFKYGNMCFISIIGTASVAIEPYAVIASVSGSMATIDKYFNNINNKSYAIYANSEHITTRVALSKGETITFSAEFLIQ